MTQQPKTQAETLTERIEKARLEAGLIKPEAEDSLPAGRGLSLGLELAVAVAMGTLGGIGIDSWLNTAPLFLLLGFALGLGVGFWNLYRVSLGMGMLSVGSRKKGSNRVD